VTVTVTNFSLAAVVAAALEELEIGKEAPEVDPEVTAAGG
jgi:hypothetical protein